MVGSKFAHLTCWLMLSSFNVFNGLRTPPSVPYYIAGVLEYPGLPAQYELQDAHDRIRHLGSLLETSEIQPDIIVFPENVINNRAHPVIVPAPQDAIVPCSRIEYDFAITEMSCYARSLQMYLLINVIEVANCADTPCAVYNTNVVFDRQGVVISRYRKYNLIGAEWLYLNYTQQPEKEATFRTDFNVTFGHFTRMDLLYYRPAQWLVDAGISDFLHPSKWQSELPFMTAMQLHQSWAFSNVVNLLVAGTNDPAHGRTGTGIYAQQYGALIASMTADETKRKLYLSVLPKKGFPISHPATQAVINGLSRNGAQPRASPPQQQRQQMSVTQFTDRITGIALERDNDIDLFTTLPLSVAVDAVHQQICHDDLCCNFHIQMHAIANRTLPPSKDVTYDAYHYRLAVFRGMGRFLSTEPNALAVCALLACVGDHVHTCGRIYPETAVVENRFVFDAIEITGNFTQRALGLILPSSVDGMLAPLPVDAFELAVKQMGNVSFVNYTLLQPKADLLTFGIYVNYFLDETIYDHHTKADASSFSYKYFIILVLIKVVYLLS